MRILMLLGAIALTTAIAANAQLGDIFNRAKGKLDDAQQRAKPVTDRGKRAAETFNPWSAKDEQEIGEAGAAKMIAVFGLVDNDKVVRYVNLVGQAVGQFASRRLPWRFGVLDSDIVGAFALPGGYIFITRGALSGMTNEAQLAGTLGHEVIHCAERHLEREIRGKKTSVWAMQEVESFGNSSDFAALKAEAFVRDLLDTKLSRGEEEAADEQGSELAVKAGYSSAGLMQFLIAMREANKNPDNQKMFGQMLSTHPSFDSRIAHLQPSVIRAGSDGQTLEERFQEAIFPN